MNTLFIKRIWVLAGVLLFLVGCTNDLDVEPGDPEAFLDTDFYADPASYRSGLAGVYGNLSLTGTDGAGSSNIQGLDAGTSQYGCG